MIPDAPGLCKEYCSNGVNRDDNGNCISQVKITIPNNCLTWYDGCNTCMVNNGILGACSRIMCFRIDTPRCIQYVSTSGH